MPKLCENPRETQTKLISDPQEQYSLLSTPGIEVTNLLFAGDEVVWAAWCHAKEARVQNLRHTNDVIVNYVTAAARLHLYEYLTESVLYCDTDRVVLIEPRDGAALVEIGDCLGAMTLELKTNDIILEFVSGGPKNYAYKTLNSVTHAEK